MADSALTIQAMLNSECKKNQTCLKSVSPLIAKISFYEKLLIINYASLIFTTCAKFLAIFILFDTIILVNILYNNLFIICDPTALGWV